MKKSRIFIILFVFSLFCIICCTKERFIKNNIVTTVQTGLHLLDFKNTRQSNSLNTVTIRWSDADSTNTSYNIILSDSTGVLAQDGGVVKQAIYNNLRSNHTYRHKIFSVPRNDSLTIRFNIGTMGDVDIKTE